MELADASDVGHAVLVDSLEMSRVLDDLALPRSLTSWKQVSADAGDAGCFVWLGRDETQLMLMMLSVMLAPGSATLPVSRRLS